MTSTCIGLLFIMWCNQGSIGAASGATFCQIYQPVYWSPEDTRKTKEQNDTLNRIWKTLCQDKQSTK